MPRPILGGPQSGAASRSLRKHAPGGATDARLQQRLRQSRSKAYLDALARLDAAQHHGNRAALDDLLAAIAAEFPDLTIDQRPMGLVSECFLGSPYEVHICDFAGDIIEHYETFRSMPALFQRARSLAVHPSYVFIEVYPDVLRAVSADGSVSVVER